MMTVFLTYESWSVHAFRLTNNLYLILKGYDAELTISENDKIESHVISGCKNGRKLNKNGHI